MIKSAILAAVASLTFAPYVSAHHPSADVNPNYDEVDDQISDQHNIIIGAMLEEDDSLMASTLRGTDNADEARAAAGDGANASQATNQSAVPTDTATGMSRAAQTKAGR